MKTKIKIVGIVCTLATAMMAGCGGRGTATDAAAATKDYVYRVEEMELPKQGNGNHYIVKGGDRLYAYSYDYHYSDDSGTSRIYLYSLNEDGTVKEQNQILMESDSVSIGSLTPDGEGFLYGVKNVYMPDEEGIYQDEYYLVKYSEQGERVFETRLNDVPELAALGDGNYFYAGGITLAGDDVYVNVMGTFARFDCDGNFRNILKSGDGSSFEGTSFYVLGNGKVAAVNYEEAGVYAAYVDLQTGNLSDRTMLPGNAYQYSIYAGAGKYDLYLVDYYGVYGYNIGDEDKKLLMNYLDSDLGINMVYNLVVLDDREFMATYDDMETYESRLGRFSKVDPKDVKDKQVIVLACSGLDWNVREAVVKFNKNNENYRVTIQDYDSMYNTTDDYMAGQNRLNADIVSGKVPDILLLNSNMPSESYISKGLFADLKPFIEADEEIELSDLMPNIVEAYSVDGRLYGLVPHYTISTMIAKSSDVGKERGWTVQEARDVLASKPEGTLFVNYISRGNMLTNSLIIAGNQFIDWESGKCNFDSEGFVQLLEFANEFPEEIDSTMFTDEYWDNYDTMWREGRALTMLTSLNNFRDFNRMEKGTFGEDITAIGYPSSNEDGSAIVAGFELAMSAKSSKQEGAWEFMRYFLTEEYQSEIRYAFPISITRMNEMAEEAKRPETYTDENGNEVEFEETYYLGGVEITLPLMTQQEAEELKELLYSFTNVYNYNENLIQIVDEEAASYFAGQKSASEVAAIIQSRAQIYVNENR